MYGNNPFDFDEEGEFRCPSNHVAGLNLLTEMTLSRLSWSGDDIVATRQLAGIREGALVPEPSFLISPALFRLIRDAGGGGAQVRGGSPNVARPGAGRRRPPTTASATSASGTCTSASSTSSGTTSWASGCCTWRPATTARPSVCFVQPDPDRSEANLYAYAADNPVTEMDSDGTCSIVCQLIVGAVIDSGRHPPMASDAPSSHRRHRAVVPVPDRSLRRRSGVRSRHHPRSISSLGRDAAAGGGGRPGCAPRRIGARRGRWR